MRIDGIHDITCITADDEPPRPAAARIPPEHALLGFAGVRAYSRTPAEAERLLTHELGCTLTAPGTHALAGGRHHATHAHDEPPAAVGNQGARTVHHVAWCDRDAEHATSEEHLIRIGVDPT